MRCRASNDTCHLAGELRTSGSNRFVRFFQPVACRHMRSTHKEIRQGCPRIIRTTPLIVRANCKRQSPEPLRASIGIPQQDSFASGNRQREELARREEHEEHKEAQRKCMPKNHPEDARKRGKIPYAATIHFCKFAVSSPGSAQSTRAPSGPSGERSMAIESPSTRRWYEQRGMFVHASVTARVQSGLGVP